MIRFVADNIFATNAAALVNPVNCAGAMGKGIALGVKQRWRACYSKYQRDCERGNVRPGDVTVFNTGSSPIRYVVNFPTKRHWRDPSHLSDVIDGLPALVTTIQDLQLSSIAIPPLGCGNGGLRWTDVRPLIIAAMAPLQDVDIRIHGRP